MADATRDASITEGSAPRVWFLLDSLGAGGTERSTALLLPALVERGVDVRVLLFKSTEEGSEAAVRDSGVPVTVLTGSALRRVLDLWRLLRRARPDILHTALYEADQIGRIAAFPTRTRVVSSLVNVPPDPDASERAGAAWKLALVDGIDRGTAWLAVDRFHAVTAGVARTMADAHRVPRSRVAVVERGRTTAELGRPGADRRSAVRAGLGLDDATFVVVALGRHERLKDFATLIRAFGLSHGDRDAVLLLAGREGATSDELRTIVSADPRLASRVRILGHRTDVGDLLAASDVFALSSTREGAAGALLEAMYLGTPIVCTDLPGLEGVAVDGRNALVVPVRDPAAMADALRATEDDRPAALRRAAVAQDDFDARFTIDRAADGMVALYRDVRRTPRCARFLPGMESGSVELGE